MNEQMKVEKIYSFLWTGLQIICKEKYHMKKIY